MDILPHLKNLADAKGSALYFNSGTRPQMKLNGQITPTPLPELAQGDTSAIANRLMNEQQAEEFAKQWEMNFVHQAGDLGRFRVNVYRERGETALVIRRIPSQLPTIDELKLPRTAKKLVTGRQGLILICGPTGSGKSTTMAAMLHYRNERMAGHILSIEDPVEFIHTPRKSIFSHREVGTDTLSFEHALKNALRESPDVIMLGEIREKETMHYAINYALTGHLCIASLHANNTQQAIERIINFFPQNQHSQILLDLSSTLRGIIAQRLLPNTSGQLQVMCEVLLHNATISDLIQKGNITEIRQVIEKHSNEGMQSFNQSLLHFVQTGQLTEEEAVRQSDSQTDLQLQIRLGDDAQVNKGGAEFNMGSEL